MRPILITICTMVFAMRPLAVKIGTGSEERTPMATVLVGAMLTSTLLTLIFVPVMYTCLDDFDRWLQKLGLMAIRWDTGPAMAIAMTTQPVVGASPTLPVATDGPTVAPFAMSEDPNRTAHGVA